jgi:hypothetical protein
MIIKLTLTQFCNYRTNWLQPAYFLMVLVFNWSLINFTLFWLINLIAMGYLVIFYFKFCLEKKIVKNSIAIFFVFTKESKGLIHSSNFFCTEMQNCIAIQCNSTTIQVMQLQFKKCIRNSTAMQVMQRQFRCNSSNIPQYK